MTILYLSDFDLKAGGYSGIAIKLCTHLAQNGYDVQALGFGYNGEEHYYPFRIAPLNGIEMAVPIIRDLQRQGVEIEAVVVALDIPLQEAVLQKLNAPGDLPYIGLFPLEAPPLTQSWALSLLRMDAQLVMSRFGVEACRAGGVNATFIPIGVDTESWRPPTVEEREQLRKGLGIEPDTFVVLTVADNQERKNLSRSMEIFADFTWGFRVEPNKPEQFKGKTPKDAKYLMVTRTDSPVGWKISDYALDLGIYSQLFVWSRGMPFKQLWSLFAVSDCFLLTSKAEGLAMPVLEAMSMRVPVVGTCCTAIREHLYDSENKLMRGFSIDTDYEIIDPFGNGKRYFASRKQGANWLLEVEMQPKDIKDFILDNAQAYVLARTWDSAGQVLIETIEHVKEARQPKMEIPVITHGFLQVESG